MKIRRFFGKDMREALRNVKEELGADAVILSNKKLADGIELVAAYDKEPSLAKPAVSQVANKASATLTKKQPSLSEIIGDSGPDSLRALLEKQSQNNEQAASEKAVEDVQHVATEAAQHRPPIKQSSTHNVGDDRAMDHIRQELKSLRHVLEYQVSGLLKQEQRRSNPLQAYLITRLEQMGIDSALAEDVVSYAPADADERDAWLFLLKLLANRITTGGDSILSQTGVVALVGPTGTGKTTTIAKLAARYAQKYGAEQVAMVTIDSYRIAAYEQLATYGKIIGCQVKKAQSDDELEDVLYQLRHKRLILIDTAGFGQRDGRLIKQLDTLQMHSCANIKKYLVVQANSQYQVIDRTINAYKQISLHGCIFTKLDECYSLGEAISAAIRHRLPVTYLTDGQRVPEDIRVADAKYLITMAAKLYKKYALTHTVSGQTTRSAALV